MYDHMNAEYLRKFSVMSTKKLLYNNHNKYI